MSNDRITKSLFCFVLVSDISLFEVMDHTSSFCNPAKLSWSHTWHTHARAHTVSVKCVVNETLTCVCVFNFPLVWWLHLLGAVAPHRCSSTSGHRVTVRVGGSNFSSAEVLRFYGPMAGAAAALMLRAQLSVRVARLGPAFNPYRGGPWILFMGEGKWGH